MEVPKGLPGVANSAAVKTRNPPPGARQALPGKRPPILSQDDSEEELLQEEGATAAVCRISAPSDLSYTTGNAFEGIALLEIADESLNRMFSTLQDARTLVVQAGESVHLPDAYSRLQRQLQQRLDAMDGIAATTSFKGKKIFQGGLGSAYFQIDLSSGKMLCINLDPCLRRSAIGAIASTSSRCLDPLFGNTGAKGVYSTPPITDLNFFTAPRHAIFDVDGIPVGLFRDWRGDSAAAAASLQERLNAQNNTGHYEVSYTNQRFTITSNRGTSPVLSASSLRGSEFTGGSIQSTQKPAPLTLVSGDFRVQVGNGTAHSVIGTFSHIDELMRAINSQVPGATAHANQSSGTLVIAAYETLILSGNRAGAPHGLGFDLAPTSPGGNLTTVSLLQEEARIDALLRIDAALTYLTALRITFNEMKKRFHEALATMQTRALDRGHGSSQIVDASSLSESLARTREQLPQQAKNSIQAQANASPSAVNMLLNQGYQASELKFCHLRCEKGKERCS